jgi:hypothetical protein
LKTRQHGIFRVIWWSGDVLPATAVLPAPLAGRGNFRLRMPRYHLRTNAIRVGAAFLSAPEIKQ